MIGPLPRTQIRAAMAQLIARRGDLMLDECTVTRPETVEQTPVLDADGNVADLPDPTVYAGRCTVADPRSALQANRTVSDESGAPNQRVLRLPSDSAGLRPGDVVEVTASLVSPGLVGDRFVVVGEEERTYATYRRYQVRGSSWVSATIGG